MSLTIDDQERGDVLVVSVTGRLDGLTSKSLEGHLGARVAEAKSGLVLNLEGVGYVSSFGLRLILLTAKKLGSSGRRFVVCGLNDNVRNVFTVSGFASIIAIRGSVDEAVAAAAS